MKLSEKDSVFADECLLYSSILSMKQKERKSTANYVLLDEKSG